MHGAIDPLRRLRPCLAARSVLLLLAIAGVARAQTIQEEGVACKDAAGMELPETECAERAWRKADAELNRVFERVRRKMPAKGLEPPYEDKDIAQELASAQRVTSVKVV